jgi:beta-N-acetylhexosaminidase
VPQVTLTWNQWKKSDGLPFRAAIDAGVEMVMVGHLRYPEWDDQPMSLSKVAVSKLRNNLNYDRVILTDDLGMGALSGLDPFEVMDRAIDAGMDMLLYTKTPAVWPQMIDHVEKRVRAGDVSRKRIDMSVRRILRLKVDHFRLKR